MKSTLNYDAILVTGGAGFIGSHTVDALLSLGIRVWVLDDLSTGSRHNLKSWRGHPGLKFKLGSVTDYSTVEAIAKRVDAIIHLAAISSPAISLKKPELTNAANVLGTLNLLKAAADNHVQRFVFASSAAIYGNTNVTKISEAAPLRPISPYGVSKLAAEKYCEVYHTIHGLSTVSLRYFNVYGQRQRADNPYSGVIAIFARKLMAGRRTTITGNGLQSRDFVHVSDVVNSNLLALTTEEGVGKSYNIGTGRATSIKRLHSILAHLAGTKSKAIFAPARVGDIIRSCASIENAQRELGYAPRTELEEGLKQLVGGRRKVRVPPSRQSEQE